MTTTYPEKYLEGLRLFNEEEFFECHDVLEELWAETLGSEKKFYQGLIQLSISLFHFGNENYGGAKKLYDSSRKYLDTYRPEYMGINVDELLARSASGSTGWYLTDRLGSVRQVTNLAGVVMDAITYDGFGRVISETMPRNSATSGLGSGRWKSPSVMAAK